MSGSESMEGSNKIGHSNCPVSGQDQVSPNRKLLPALLKLGFRSRKKSCSSQDLLPDTITASNARSTTHKEKVCSRNVPCAGRVIRNMFISNGRCPSNNHVQLARIIRRTYIGLELVQWLTEHCLLIQSRSMATAVWNILLQLGILLSVERERAFEDSSALYQFSFEECEAQSCVYGNELEWQRGVHQLLQLVPHVQLRAGALRPLPDRPQTRPESRVPRFQMQVMGSLTAAVQNELVAVLARRVPRPSLWEDSGLDQLTENPPKRPSASQPKPAGDAAVRVCVGERGCEALLLQRAPSARPPPSSSIRGGRREERDRRYPAVAGTPEKILEHLLSSLRLDENQGGTQAKESETLLDDFLLTYLVFMSTNDLCQALLGQYCSKRHRTKEDGADVLQRKRKVLHLANQWSSLCRDLQQEHDHAKLFVKTLYRYVLDDLYEYPTLEKDLKELQKLLRLQRRHTVDEFSPHRKNKTLFHQLSLREAWQHQRATPRESREVLCRVYVTEDSYLSVRTHGTVTAQELLAVVAERLGCAEDDLELMSFSYPGEKLLLQPHHSIFSDPLLAAGRLHACRRDRRDSMNPLSDSGQLQQSAVRLLGMNTWHVAVALTSCDWSLFCSVHEQELVYFTFGRDAGPGHTVALELLLQRCNEVQFWVMSEVLLCPTLCKRVQLFKKFIKIAAHCKAQRNLNSFFAIIMGLNTAAVSRLTQTWEKVPGKFRKLFSELESLTDPSFNHKAYREAFKKMKSPKIPFLPLLLKDITFIHEGNKTFLDNLVNFEKLHMIADTVRILRHCRVDHMGSMLTQKESPEVRVYVNNLHVIDNQQTLFELSHGLEPRA